MSALLYKDLRNLRRYIVQLLAICLAFGLIFGISNGNFYFVSGYAEMLSLMLVLNSMAYDEQCGWYRCALTMPISRKMLVGGKYLLGLISVVGGMIYALLLSAVGTIFFSTSFLEALCASGASSCVALILMSVLLPALFRYGTEKARLLMVLIFLLPVLLVLLLSRLGLPAPDPSLLIALLIALPFVSVAMYLLSFLLSVRWFQIKLP